MDERTEQYLKLQEGSGLRKGDFVRVIKIVDEQECLPGGALWHYPSRSHIGQIGKIIGVDRKGNSGVDVYFDKGGADCLPFFALEKIGPQGGILRAFDPALVRQHEDDPWSCAFYQILMNFQDLFLQGNVIKLRNSA